VLAVHKQVLGGGGGGGGGSVGAPACSEYMTGVVTTCGMVAKLMSRYDLNHATVRRMVIRMVHRLVMFTIRHLSLVGTYRELPETHLQVPAGLSVLASSLGWLVAREMLCVLLLPLLLLLHRAPCIVLTPRGCPCALCCRRCCTQTWRSSRTRSPSCTRSRCPSSPRCVPSSCAVRACVWAGGRPSRPGISMTLRHTNVCRSHLLSCHALTGIAPHRLWRNEARPLPGWV
jgi:hypothetical protein